MCLALVEFFPLFLDEKKSYDQQITSGFLIVHPREMIKCLNSEVPARDKLKNTLC